MGTFRYIGTPALIARGLNALERAVTDSAEDLVAQAQAATPVDTGTLRASINTDGAQRAGNTVQAVVQTGGEANDYAIYVHEGTSRGMPSFKYIEGPLLDNRSVYVEAITRAARGAY